MANKKRNKKGTTAQEQADVVAEEAAVEESVAEEAAAPAAEEAPKKRKSYYNPETAKAYRERIMEYAKKGGYEPKPRAEGTGASEKRTSKSGKTYYYTPWSKLTDEQKASRLAQARERSKKERELARKYKEEHPEEFASDES